MRQRKNEFNIDPKQAYGTRAVGAPEIPYEFQQDHNKWVNNTVNTRSHKFCANQCLNFISGSGVSDNEQSCLTTCFTKYSSALSAFYQEKNFFTKSLEDLQLRGQDQYAARDI